MGQSKDKAIQIAEMNDYLLKKKVKDQENIIKELKAQIEAIREYYELDESDLERFTDGLDDGYGCGHDECSQDDTSLYRQLTDE